MIQPPTDNLYKFLAIFGVVLIATGGWMRISVFSDFNETMNKIETKDAEYFFAVNEFTQLLSQYNQQIKNLNRKIKNGDNLDIEAKKLDRLNDQLSRIIKQDRFSTEKFSARGRRFVSEYQFTEMQAILGFWMIAGGVTIALVGFVLWYFLLQRHLDRRINLEKEKKEDSNS